MAKRERSIEPAEYLNYLIDAWNPILAAERLGCDVADIRELQRSRKFIERYLTDTVMTTGPREMQELTNKTAIELIQDQKLESFWALKEMGQDPEVPPNVRARIHGKFFEQAAAIEGVNQKVQHEHTVTHKLDAESVLALESARAESARLLANPSIDVTGEEVDA